MLISRCRVSDWHVGRWQTVTVGGWWVHVDVVSTQLSAARVGGRVSLCSM